MPYYYPRPICFYLIIFVGILFVGCSSGNESPTKADLKPITLTKELTISADNPEVLIGNFAGLTVDNQGRIAATDTRRQRIHLFSSDGQYLDSLGRKGKGPGEFQRLEPETRLLSDTLYAKDSGNKRINLFSLETRQPVGAINYPDAELDGVQLGAVMDIFPLSDGNLLVAFVNPYRIISDREGEPRFITISLLNKSGDFIEKKRFQLSTPFPTGQYVARFDGRSMYVFSGLSFYPTIKMGIDYQEHLHIGLSDSLIIREYDENGAISNVISENYKPVPLGDSYMDSLYSDRGDIFEKAVNEAGRPDNWPAFENFFFDDSGRCWVELINSGKSQKAWWIFDEDDKARWKLQLPKEITLFEVQNGKAYGISQPPEGGISGIVRYEINGI